jgi:WD40 repeat protein
MSRIGKEMRVGVPNDVLADRKDNIEVSRDLFFAYPYVNAPFQVLLFVALTLGAGCSKCQHQRSEKPDEPGGPTERLRRDAGRRRKKADGLVRNYNGNALRGKYIRHIEFLKEENRIVGVRGRRRLTVWDWKKEEEITYRRIGFSAYRSAISRDRRTYLLSSMGEPYRLSAFSTEDLHEKSTVEVEGQVVDLACVEECGRVLVVHTAGVDIWDRMTGKLFRLTGGRHWHAGTVGKNGRIALGSGPYLQLRNLQDETVMMEGFADVNVAVVSFQNGGDTMIVGGDADSRFGKGPHLEIWSSTTLTRKKHIPVPMDTIVSVYSLGSQGLLLGGPEGLLVLDKRGEREAGVKEWATHVAVSPSRKYAASAWIGISVYRLPDLETVSNKKRLVGEVRDVEFAGQAGWIVASDRHATIAWDVKSGRFQRRFSTGGIFCVLSGGPAMMYDQEDSAFVVYDEEGRLLSTHEVAPVIDSGWGMSCKSRIAVAVIKPGNQASSGKVFLAKVADGTRRIEVDTGVLGKIGTAENQGCFVDPKGQWFVVFNGDTGKIAKWEIDTYDEAAGTTGVEYLSKWGENAIVGSENGRFIAVCVNRRITVVDSSTLSVQYQLETDKRFKAVALDDKGERVAISCEDGQEVFVWSREKGHVVNRFSYSGGHATALEFDPRGTYLGAGYSNSEVILWDLSVTGGKKGTASAAGAKMRIRELGTGGNE